MDSNDSYFKPCYDSCKSCDRKENEEFHYCLECKNGYDNNFSYQNRKYFNCYKEITYYYFDRNIKKYYFFTYTQCPSNHSKAIINKRQCIEECYLDNQYYYEFKKKCYKYCPDNTNISEDKTYYCDPICPSDLPFEILDTQECVENCDISMIYNNSCRLNYDKTNINIFLNNIHNNLISINFNFSKINNNEDIIFRFLNNTIIITTDNKNLKELEECEFMLRNHYNISNEEHFYKIIKMESNEDRYNIKYQIYYSLNRHNLEELDLNLCNYTCEEKKCLSCSQRSVFFDLCISCNENYYPILNDSSNIYSYTNCYQNPEGYYLDKNDSVYKLCYTSCKLCDRKGDEEIHNCILCAPNFIYEFNFQNYTNCYDKCKYYFYHDNITNTSYCTEELKCPSKYNKLITNNNQCIENCKMDNVFKYEFKKQCYSKCPENTESSEINEFYCDPKCTKEKPFEIIDIQECINNCSIYELMSKTCRLNYDKRNIKFISNYLINKIEKELFNITDVNLGNTILIEEKYAIFTITNDNLSEIFECENTLRNYYDIQNEEKILKLKIEYLENKTIWKTEYHLFYKLEDKNIQELDLSICYCKEEKCSLCSNTSLKYNLCISCNENYYPILNDSSNMFSFVNCYQNPEGFYLDKEASVYKPCYSSCKSCDIKGNKEIHNCISCAPNHIYELNFQNYINCYDKCEFYFYFNNSANKYYCTETKECPNEYNKLLINNNECIEDCKMDNTYKYEFQKQCYSKCPENTETSEIQEYYCKVKCPKEFPFEIVKTQQCVSNCSITDRQKKLCISNYISKEEDKEENPTLVQDAIINDIRGDLTSNFNTSDIDKGEDIVIEEKGTKLTITTTDNQKNSEKDKNSTTINLGECETKLKEHYKIPLDKSLYILKLDVTQEGMKIPKIEYEVYYNLNEKNLEKLNLTVCENSKVELAIPAEINEDLDKLNTSSAYFNDICYTSTSDSGTDISLADRKKEFVENNKTLCEENCEFTKYNYETGKAICSCNIKISLPLVSEISFDKNKLFTSFTDINNIVNYKIMKCYKKLLNKKNYTSSYSSFILIPIFLFHLISLISACAKGNKYIKNQIEEITIAKIKFKFSRKQYIKYQKILKSNKDIQKNKTKSKKGDKNKINDNNDNGTKNENETIEDKTHQIKKKKIKKGKKKSGKKKKLNI